MKVLLTGANGFVGSHVLDQLLIRGLATVVLLRPTSKRHYLETHLPHLEVRTGSLDDPASLDAALCDVTHVIHCAGCTKTLNPDEFFTVNHLGTRNIIEAVNRQGGQVQRLVYVSSLAAGGPAMPDRPAREENPPCPVSIYGRSKLDGERGVRETCKTDYVILRPSAVYGPRDVAFLPLFKAVRAHLRPYFGDGKQALSLVFVRDLAEVITECLTHPAATGNTYYVAATEVTSVEAMSRKIALQLNTKTVPVPLPLAALWPLCCLQEFYSWLTHRPSVVSRQKHAELRAPGWVCDPTRLRRETGMICATPLMEGIADTVAWYRAAGWL